MNYKVFISYSHAADNKLTPSLQSALQEFAKPFYRLRALNVFRDKTSLRLTPMLWPSIQSALHNSEYFLLMASPDAANSEWVQKEVEEWHSIKNGSLEKFLIVLTDGQIEWDNNLNDFNWNATTALPKSLKGRFKQVPFYLDMRWAKLEDKLSLRNPLFLDDVATLAATLHDKSKDIMVGEDVRQHRVFKLVSMSAIVILTLLLALSVIAGLYANERRKEAIQAAEKERAAKKEAEKQSFTARINNLSTIASLMKSQNSSQALRLAEVSYTLQPNGRTSAVLHDLLSDTLLQFDCIAPLGPRKFNLAHFSKQKELNLQHSTYWTAGMDTENGAIIYYDYWKKNILRINSKGKIISKTNVPFNGIQHIEVSPIINRSLYQIGDTVFISDTLFRRPITYFIKNHSDLDAISDDYKKAALYFRSAKKINLLEVANSKVDTIPNSVSLHLMAFDGSRLLGSGFLKFVIIHPDTKKVETLNNSRDDASRLYPSPRSYILVNYDVDHQAVLYDKYFNPLLTYYKIPDLSHAYFSADEKYITFLSDTEIDTRPTPKGFFQFIDTLSFYDKIIFEIPGFIEGVLSKGDFYEYLKCLSILVDIDEIDNQEQTRLINQFITGLHYAVKKSNVKRKNIQYALNPFYFQLNTEENDYNRALARGNELQSALKSIIQLKKIIKELSYIMESQ